MIQLLHGVVQGLIRAIQPFIIPICFVFAWVFIFLLIWSIVSAILASLANAKQMHQIPCADCQFFTRSYHLKCPVHPSRALSEAAINCPDYEPSAYGMRTHSE